MSAFTEELQKLVQKYPRELSDGSCIVIRNPEYIEIHTLSGAAAERVHADLWTDEQ